MAVSLYAGAVNDLPCQSSRKKPMVAAVAGSTPGTTVVSSTITGGFGSSVVFLHEQNMLRKISGVVINRFWVGIRIGYLMIL
jgi:hypothetical protein